MTVSVSVARLRSGRQDFVLHPWELGGCLKLLPSTERRRRECIKASFRSRSATFSLLSSRREHILDDAEWVDDSIRK